MANFTRGTKRRCGHCGAPFYDLDHSPVVCPKCQHEYVAPPQRLPSRSRTYAAPPPAPRDVEENQFEEDEALVAEDDDEIADTEDAEEDGDESRLAE